VRFWPNYLFIDFAEAFERHPEMELRIYVHFWVAAQAIADWAIELGLEEEDIPEFMGDDE
jgi:hypothetical protein